tara:strand:- start:417 stop:743 length:327 start_codon:yes stop_codon:yes gene_type:complete
MKAPKLVRVLNKSLILAVAFMILSFIIPIAPCKTAAVTAEPIYEWGLCKFQSPFTQQSLGLLTKYYGSTTDTLNGFIIHFAVFFIIITLILLSIRRKTAKVLDLTNKK